VGAVQQPNSPHNIHTHEIQLLEIDLKHKQDVEDQIKKTHTRRLFLADLLNHYTAFKDYHAKLNVHIKKMSVQVLQYITALERRKRKEEDKERKLRMKALKANDMEAYMKLVQNHKNDRLSQLIEQTNEFLKQIGEKVESENVSRLVFQFIHVL
jgi:hypothetical protein